MKETASLQRMARRQPALFGSLLSKLIVVIDNPQKAGEANKEESANAFIAALKNANSEALQRIWPISFTPDPTS